LIYVNTKDLANPAEALRELSAGIAGAGGTAGVVSTAGVVGKAGMAGTGGASGMAGAGVSAVAPGFDDVFVFAPVGAVVEQADAILAYDGCLNFFAGPSDQGFKAKFNFYNVHYNSTHLVGTSGGNTDDMKEALILAAAGAINPSILITHIGGLDAARGATLTLPEIPGGKKLIYTHISMPLTAIDDFRELGKSDPMFAVLADLCEREGGLWNGEAEQYLLANANKI
jgi:threonine dehydrogenase-like Zn-dependent dehydrogenase